MTKFKMIKHTFEKQLEFRLSMSNTSRFSPEIPLIGYPSNILRAAAPATAA
jgi:hypothetical protein